MAVYFPTKDDEHETEHNYGVKVIWKFATEPKMHIARNRNSNLRECKIMNNNEP